MNRLTVREARSSARNRARNSGADPRDADLLLAELLGWKVTQLIARDDAVPDDETLQQFEDLLLRRLRGEPLQYILRKAEFYSRSYVVDERVLIPRPETELLVEAVLQIAPRNGSVIDIGTGSGCIAVSLALERSDLDVHASDNAIGALAVARQNARRHHADVAFLASDGFDGIRATFDLIVSNPPYIAGEEIASLQTEVRDHEPLSALTPGADPLQMIRRLYAESREHLRPGGRLIMEIGYGQAAAVRRLASDEGWRVDEILNDLAAIPRVVISSPAR